MQENGRQRAAKIDRHYHATFDRFISRKRWMGILGLMIGLAYSAWMFLSNGALQITTGELSQPHFAWNKTGCEKCHLPNVPIRNDAWGGDLIHNIAKNRLQCNGNCHTITGHFESKTKNGVVDAESCSTCHREHLGFDRTLVEVSDTDCARCHANMQSVATNPESKTHVSNFSKTDGHPPFASLKEPDPGTIRFSHMQHMRPGQPKEPGGADAKTLEMLPDRFRARYEKRLDAEKLIQLRCSDCHSRDVELKGYEGLESEIFMPSAAVQSSSHRLYKPIEFDKHCAACHDLDGIPHGLSRTQTSQAIKEAIPVKTLDFLKTLNNEDELETLADGKISMEMKEIIGARKTRLQAMLGDGGNACKKCHQPLDDANSFVAPSNLKQKWFRDASFTHGAHLMVSCKECHAGAYTASSDVFDWERNKNSEQESNHVMIPGIAKCRECHIQDAEERSRSFGKENRVASANCADCHRYHSDPPKTSAPKSAGAAASLSEVHRFLANETSP